MDYQDQKQYCRSTRKNPKVHKNYKEHETVLRRTAEQLLSTVHKHFIFLYGELSTKRGGGVEHMKKLAT